MSDNKVTNNITTSIGGLIVIGDIRYHDDKNLLFGPALIHAYELESKHSIYPRFILDTKIIDLIKGDIKWMDLSIDVDGHYYVDPFSGLVKLEGEENSFSTY